MPATRRGSSAGDGNSKLPAKKRRLVDNDGVSGNVAAKTTLNLCELGLQRKKKSAKMITPAKAKDDKPNADNDSDDGGFFDSDSNDDEPKQQKKPSPKKKVMSKKERLEALANKH